MTAVKRCRRCEGPLEIRRENYQYTASGLDDVILGSIEVRYCSACGDRTAIIPRIEALHRAIAIALAEKRERLLPKEIRFLRKYMGLSSSDFARKIGVNKATISRYESLDDPKPMGKQTERLLRLMVLSERPIESYPLEEMANEAPKAERMVLAPNSAGWHREQSVEAV
ncbi:helix-turn-helix domain-containing protein [Archangium gephyra]|uniref:type II TA system antitoxin MqsA family protein n=1 Tax=Archangium gephyra TaxID=48 RepID=UPI0035D466AA